MKGSILIIIFLSLLIICISPLEGVESVTKDKIVQQDNNNKPIFSSEQMMETIGFLSDEELMGRGIGTEGLDKAAEFIAGKFREIGLEPAGDSEGSYFQIWYDTENKIKMENIIGVISGKNTSLSKQSVVVGAHYDHIGLGQNNSKRENKGKIHPGADDNASGIAVLLEVAKVFCKKPLPDRNIVFVAFTGEENGRKGSRYYLDKYKRYPAEQCIAMLNIDTVGRLHGKNLMVIGANSAKEWLDIFRRTSISCNLGIDIVKEGLDSSDQVSFHEKGIPAAQLFSGPHTDYHCPTDTVDKIDRTGLLKVVSVAKEVVEYLSKQENPFTVTFKHILQHDESTKRERKVSLGVIPDFSYNLKGVRLSGVVPRSPAESCGMREGDVIIKINTNPIINLKDFSLNLKSLKPGDRISITYIRNDEEKTVEAEVIRR